MKVHFQVEKSVIAAVVPVPDTHDRSVGGGDSGMADTARVAEEAVGGIIESNVGDSNNLVLDMLPDSYYYKILTCDIMSETEETLKNFRSRRWGSSLPRDPLLSPPST